MIDDNAQNEKAAVAALGKTCSEAADAEPMSPTSLALSSVLDDDDINEVSNMEACRPDRTVPMEQIFFDGMTKLARQERNLEVGHSAPIKTKRATQDGASQMLGR